MTALPTRNHILLGGVCSALTLLLAYEVVAAPAAFDVPVLRWQPKTAPYPLQLAPPFPPETSFAAIDARPVFSPARKPVQQSTQAKADAVPPPSDLSLIGVIIDGDRRLALLHSPASPLEISVTVGGAINGWQVRAIEPDRVVLHSGSTDYPIALNTHHAPPLSSGPAARPAADMTPPPSDAPPTSPNDTPGPKNPDSDSGDQ